MEIEKKETFITLLKFVVDILRQIGHLHLVQLWVISWIRRSIEINQGRSSRKIFRLEAIKKKSWRNYSNWNWSIDRDSSKHRRDRDRSLSNIEINENRGITFSCSITQKYS
jgi:hypothetical protein